MIIINNDNCTDVIYKGKSSDALYLGETECWRKKKEAYLTTGPLINAALNKEATSFTKSSVVPTNNITTTDISEIGDNSIVTWYDTSTTTQYYYTPYPVVMMNSDSVDMFKDCTKMTSIDLSKFNTEKVKNMGGIFYNCSSLTELDLSNFNTSKTITMASMFASCSGLTSLDVSHFDTSNVTSMSYMFSNIKCAITYGDNFVMGNALYNNTAESSSSNRTYRMFYNSTSNKPTGGNWDLGIWNSAGTFMKATLLTTGPNMYDIINTDATAFIPSTTDPAESVTVTDISSAGDNSVVTWYDADTTTQYWYTEANIVCLNPDCSSMFANKALKELDLSYFDTSKVTNMRAVFAYCTALTSLNISTWDTSNVTNMGSMFSGCSALVTLDLSNFNTSKVTDMEWMFSSCNALTTLNISSFDTSEVTDVGAMFTDCTSLKTLDISHFNISKAALSGSLFAGAIIENLIWHNADLYTHEGSESGKGALQGLQVKVLDLTGAKMPEYSEIFFAKHASMIEEVNLSNVTFSEVTTSIEGLFVECSKLKKVNLSGVDTSTISNMQRMFSECTSLTTVTYGDKFTNIAIPSDTLSATDVTNMTYQMFYNCPAPKPSLWANGEWAENGTYIYKVYMHGNIQSCIDSSNAVAFQRSATAPADGTATESLALDGKDTIVTWMDPETKIQYWYSKAEKVFLKDNCDGAFMTCSKMKSIDLSGIDMTEVTSMAAFFSTCAELTTITPSVMDLSNVKSTYNMFQDDTALVNLDISGWKISNATDMSYMFGNCSALTTLNISGIDTTKANNVSGMFLRCSKLTTVTYGDAFTLSDTLLAEYASGNYPTGGMFDGCPANKPTWTGGEWAEDGTFIKSA